MRSWCWLAVAIASTAPVSTRADEANVCEGSVLSPADGATSVAADTAFAFLRDRGCLAAPVVTDANGAQVAIRPVTTWQEQQSSPGTEIAGFEPAAPLPPGRYLVDLGLQDTVCKASRATSHFTVGGGTPSVRRIEFRPVYSDGDQRISTAHLYLSEPVLTPADLADPVDGYATAEVVDIPGAPVRASASGSDAVEFRFGDAAGSAESCPAGDATLRFKVRAGLAFASGQVLAEDVVLELVPEEHPAGWQPSRQEACSNDSGGCLCGPGGGGASSAALALAIWAAVARRRSRSRRPTSTGRAR